MRLLSLVEENLEALQNRTTTLKELLEPHGITVGYARKELSKAGVKLRAKREIVESQPIDNTKVATLPEMPQTLAQSEEAKAELAATRGILVKKLRDARHLLVLESWFFTINDALTADRSDVTGFLILQMKAWLDAYGFDGSGTLGHFMKSEYFERVCRYLNDLAYLKSANKDLDDASKWGMIPLHRANLSRLKAQYGAELNIVIHDRVELELRIRTLALAISPELIDEIGTMMTLPAGGEYGSFSDFGRRPMRFGIPERVTPSGA